MFCGRCGSPIPSEASYCPRCGSQTLTQPPISVELTPGPTTRGATTPGLSVEKSFWQKPANLGAALYVIIVLGAFTWYWQRAYEDWPFSIGYEVGAALVPTVIVLLYYYFRRRKGTETARRLNVLASWILIINLMSIAGQKPHLTAADVPIIAKEAAGLVPISSQSDEGRTAVRQYFKEIIARNKVYSSEVKALDFESLYTPESYLNPRESDRVIAEIDKAIQVEDDQTAALDAIKTRCTERIDSLDWSAREKTKFKEGFEEGYNKQALSRSPGISAEKEWFTSLRDLYTFVRDNHQYFRRSGETVLVTDGNVLEGFNERIRHANQLRENYQRLMKEFDAKQKQNYSALGLSTHDIGLAE
jgi:hypothetical protein